MQNLTQKARFLQKNFILLIQKINPDATPEWGKMNPQQMVEHLTEYIAMAYGNPEMELITQEEKLEKMQEWLKSEKPFKENTSNSLLPDTPPPPKCKNYDEAVEILKEELDNFFHSFDTTRKKYVMNPFFGALDYGMSIQLLYKHTTHHLRQFGVEV